MEIIARICEYCGKEFTLNPRMGINWADKTRRGRFCGVNCKIESQKGKRVSVGTEFKKTKTKQDQKNHPRYLNGIWSYQRWRKASCENCESRENLHVHHLDRNRENNELSNLRTLCKDCHWEYHRGNRNAWNKGLRRKVNV